MTDRVLRWMSAISLVLLAIDAAWNVLTLPSSRGYLPIAANWGPVFILGYLLLPTTAGAICEVTGVATLVVSLQRRQWGWFVGTLLCLVVHFYAFLALYFPAGVNYLYKLAGSAYSLGIYLKLYGALALTPLVVLAVVYAWTRHQPASDAPAVPPSPANHL